MLVEELLDERLGVVRRGDVATDEPAERLSADGVRTTTPEISARPSLSRRARPGALGGPVAPDLLAEGESRRKRPAVLERLVAAGVNAAVGAAVSLPWSQAPKLSDP